MKKFNELITTISQLHRQLQQSAVNAVNQMLTIRNWLIGYYIVEFEQNGEDRAKYGTSLLKSIAKNLEHIKGMDERSLRRFRQFYIYYPQLADVIRGTLTPILKNNEIRGSLTPILSDAEKIGTLSPQLEKGLFVPGNKILAKLSYTHIEQLLRINAPLKRAFYEIECVKGAWSVRELKRQINSQYFERSGLSRNPEQLAKLVQRQIKPQKSTEIYP